MTRFIAVFVTIATLSTSALAAPQRLTVRQAVQQALEHNLSLKVERQAAALGDEVEMSAEAEFEPELFSEVTTTHSPGQVSVQRAGLSPASSTSVGGTVGARKTFSTGTSIELSATTTAQMGGGVLDPAYQTTVALTATQPLLRNVSRSANEVGITVARLSQSEARLALARKAEQVAASTLDAYFELQSALAKDSVQEVAVQLAQSTLDMTRTLIAAGRLAPTEEVSARYTLQTQQRTRLQTRQAVADARDALARITGLVGPGSLATPELVTTDTQAALPSAAELKRLQELALAQRGDYRAALEEIKVQEAKLKAAKHRLLPKLDLVGSVFVTGLSGDSTSGTTTVDSGYWSSYAMDQVGWSAGLVFEIPLGNKAARSDVDAAERALKRARAAADLVRQTIDEELNRAWRAVTLARETLQLTDASVQVAQTNLANERELYKAGKTTAHILASVEAEAVSERLTRVQTAADLSKALVALHATSGTLLDRLGI